jgi:glycosyltransferase involved in cell wall biosynthesis
MILAIGRLIEKKGFSDLIDACAILKNKNRSFQCRILGTGELKPSLRSQMERLGLSGWVELVGPRPQGEVIQFLYDASVLVAPCIVGGDGNRDGLPNVLLEAMALGTPCIATDVTGIPEVLKHGETGWMVPQGDPAALASAIELILSQPLLRIDLSLRARQLIEREFNIHLNSARIRSLFAHELAFSPAASGTREAL